MNCIYEMRDVSDSKTQFRLGLFDSIDEAIKIINDKDKEGEAVSIHYDLRDEDNETISIVRLSKGYEVDEKDLMFFHREIGGDFMFKTYEIQDYRSVISDLV